MRQVKVGEKVINPDSVDWSMLKEDSPNYIGEVVDTHFFMIEGRKCWFSKIQFRDYSQSYAFSIIKKVKPIVTNK